MSRLAPLWNLGSCQIKLYFREPEAIFWTYGFPLLMIIALGLAFGSQGEPAVPMAIVEDSPAAAFQEAFQQAPGFKVEVAARQDALRLLVRNQVLLVLDADAEGNPLYHYDDTNPESLAARERVDDRLQRSRGRTDVFEAQNDIVNAPGSRYIDFLVPGLIGMNLMGGGMWGVGFLLVNMRVKNLIKRLLATPLNRSDFIFSMVGARAVFFLPELLFLLAASYWIFDVPIRGSVISILVIAFVGAMAFAGLGLLTASRARRLETVSGLLNLVMMPMWICSGIFFSTHRFPEIVQPFIQALPLTQLINALRAVVLEGAALSSQAVPLIVLAVWGGGAGLLALWLFRWE